MSGSRTGEDASLQPQQADRSETGAARFALALHFLLLLASLATLAVALWLLVVTAAVLPARDPGHIPMWRWAAAAFFAYSALTWLYLFPGLRSGRLRGAFVPLSAAAITLGIYGIATTIRTADSGGHFEGYVVLMSLILSGHGALGLADAALTRRTRAAA